MLQKHHNFHNVKFNSEAASANAKGVEAFKEELYRMIVDEKYLPEQKVKIDETSLFYNCMPEHTYIHEESKTMSGILRPFNTAFG